MSPFPRRGSRGLWLLRSVTTRGRGQSLFPVCFPISTRNAPPKLEGAVKDTHLHVGAQSGHL